MSHAIPLPPRPDADEYRKLAKELAGIGDDAAFERFARDWLRRLPVELDADDHVRKLKRAWSKLHAERPMIGLADAQSFLARVHGFPSWARFVDHVARLHDPASEAARFEAAADAIVAGDVATLQRLLAQDPSLVSARSTREHRSTLLHYVSANGVEDWRQRSPPNAVDVARILLDAGAQVDATSDAYAGNSTTLMLVATSAPPHAAGVQLPLLDLLVARGARVREKAGLDAIIACLWNGRGSAAAHLAGLGAPLDVEAAAGVGRADLVREALARGDAGAPPEKLRAALAWAAQYGHEDVVALLLDHGLGVDEKLPHSGQRALHWASLGAHVGIVKRLLAKHASVNAREDGFGGTPLDWALHGW